MSTNETRDREQEIIDARPPRTPATEEQQRALGRREAIASQIEANLAERKRLFEEGAKADAECVEWERSAEPRADFEALTYALASCEKLVPRELCDDRKRRWHLILDGDGDGHWATFRDLSVEEHAPSRALLELLNGMTDPTALKKETEEKGDADSLRILFAELNRQLVGALGLPPGTGASWDELLERVRMLATTGGNVELPKGEPRVAPRPDVPKVNSRWRNAATGTGPHVVESVGQTHAWVRSPGGGTTPVDFDQFGTNLVPWPEEGEPSVDPAWGPNASERAERMATEALGQANACIDAYKRLDSKVFVRVKEAEDKVERLARDLAGLVALTEAEARKVYDGLLSKDRDIIATNKRIDQLCESLTRP